MTLHIQLFGPLADAAGCRTIEVGLLGRSPTSAAGVMQQVAREHPRLEPMLSSCRLAVNCDFVTPEHPVTPSDELALIGMVSGG